MPRTKTPDSFGPPDILSFGQLMKAARVTARLTQKQICEKIHRTQSTLSYWENAGGVITVSDLKIFSDAVKKEKYIEAYNSGSQTDNIYLNEIDRIIQNNNELNNVDISSVNNSPDTLSASDLIGLLSACFFAMSDNGRCAVLAFLLQEYEREKKERQTWLTSYYGLTEKEQEEEENANRARMYYNFLTMYSINAKEIQRYIDMFKEGE